MKMKSGWKRINRKIIYHSPFLHLYEDTVELPNKEIINDYSVVKKPDIVLIVATDKNNNILVMSEYKYAVNEYLWTIPAGHVEEGESPLHTAKRELLEEVGYLSEEFEQVNMLYEYPSKDMHKVYIIRAKNITHKKNSQKMEATESISEIKLISPEELKKQIYQGQWNISAVLAAFLLTEVIS